MEPLSIKQKAINYRKKGYSYSMISEELGLAKSTLSDWLKEIPYEANREAIERIGLARAKSGEHNHNLRIQEIERAKMIAKKEIGELTKRDLWLLGLGLYLGEGSRLHEEVRLTNSDPKIIKTTLKWFKEICGLENENIVPSMHIYPDVDEQDALTYWSKIANIPKEQFAKTQVDRRKNKSTKKRRKLPYGTLHLQIRSRGKKEFGRALHRKIIGWIESMIEQI